jgi:hypothetical protein
MALFFQSVVADDGQVDISMIVLTLLAAEAS